MSNAADFHNLLTNLANKILLFPVVYFVIQILCVATSKTKV
jgi:hypothetical protein